MQFLVRQNSTVTSKGQTTIPKAVRDALELKTGDQVSFNIGRDGVSISKLADDHDQATGAFLAFLANDIEKNPSEIQPLSSALLKRAAEATQDTHVDLDDEIIGEVAL